MFTRRRLTITGITVTSILLAALGWLWLKRPLLPGDLRRQISFVVFYPSSHNPARPDRSTIKYDGSQKLLTYTARIGSTTLIVTNQAAPDAFVDIPAAYDKMLADMHAHDSFTGSLGKVTLTRPDNLNQQQVAVLNAQGTLMFVRADHDLEVEQWRKFFNSLTKL